MKVVLLGTGDAIGTPKIGCHCPACQDALNGGPSQRLRFSVLLEGPGGNVLVDTSPDLRWQMISRGLDHVEGVIWTHGHYDHYAGFGDFHRVQNHVPVYGLRETLDYILQYLGFLKPHRLDVEWFESFELAGLTFTLFPVNHPPIRESAGVMVTEGDKKVVITGDTNVNISQQSLDLMQNADLLIIDAIVPQGIDLVKHMNAAEAFELSRQLGAREVVFTHVSHMYPPHTEAVREWPLGKDGMEFII
ncbi:MAG: MBL fold metallo-hydrolase [ANME-2 cluster archaeon]|nr:MBL fold metallo-hydrolase [ANME-2 cluster archaeon]MDF1557985.1 MBL fold metallo-hydrolase [ANME-2 cluster archaeon]